ncbi:MAG: hypothetical protein ACLGI2_14445 [Acidimicrobiia bacterium]
MGGGGKKAHESYVVAPAAAGVPEGLDPVTEGDLEALEGPGAASEALAGYEAALAKAAQVANGGAEPAEAYQALSEAVGEAKAELQSAADAGLPPQLVAEHHKALTGVTKEYLGSLDPAELQSLAAAHGFEHPTLVGLNSPEGAKHPLVHWLDPAYGPESPSKLAIQAKAAERYAAVAAGETVGGQTLADVQAAEAQPGPGPPEPPGSWKASPAEVVAAQASLQDALVAFTPHGYGGDSGLGAVVAAENHLATASCPELGPALDAAKGAGKASVDNAVANRTSKVSGDVGALVDAAHADGTLGSAQAKYLSHPQQLALLRASTTTTEREGLVALAEERQAQVAKLADAKEAYQAQVPGGHIGLQDTAGLAGFASTASAYFEARDAVTPWAYGVHGKDDVTSLSGQPWATGGAPQTLTTEFRGWAKFQKLADLRAVATSMGFAGAPGASRAQVQNFIAARWDPSLDQQKIAAAVAAKPTASTAAAPTAPTAPKPPSPNAAAAVVAPPGPPTPKSFAAKHLAIVEALKGHQAIAADLPARLPPADVASWSFGAAKSANLGGGHAKTLHAAPDGSMWMFKPDKTGGGARAHAEAAASEIFSKVGVPSVPVYSRSIGGQPGSIQPLVSGATNLSADPKSWSQADVDSIVRYHVAAWAVGDHDGNPQNIIRTPSGGMCPVDQGQAFKFYGSDRLDVGYHPNSSYGSVPVFHQAYQAAKAGHLAAGVTVRPEAALPTIKAFEQLPDASYRAMLGPVATEGVAKGVHWVPAMRKAAQKRLGKTTVTDAEVAEEFLHTAVERKNGLRGSFAKFYGGLGFGGAAKIEKVA